jgi:hypothetical protein
VRRFFLAALLVSGCGSSNDGDLIDAATDGASAVDAGAIADAAPDAFSDLDQDGLDDARELELARSYLPYLALSPTDGCPLGGLVVRVRPHPAGARCVLITYDHLFNRDCGSFGGIGAHDGDNEAFGVTVDPSRPAPAGIRAIVAVSHQGTICERTSRCGDVGGLTPCEVLLRGGEAWPVVWSSKNKHGSYVSRSASCTTFGTCADTCEDNTTSDLPPIINVGEPGFPLVTNLTTQGFVTTAGGWTGAGLLDYDPWGSADFGGAGNVAGDLVDAAFVPPGCP